MKIPIREGIWDSHEPSGSKLFHEILHISIKHFFRTFEWVETQNDVLVAEKYRSSNFSDHNIIFTQINLIMLIDWVNLGVAVE